VWIAILRIKPLQRMPVKPAHSNPDEVHKQNSRQDHRQLWSAFLPYLVIILIGQIVYFMERKWASGMETGTVAGLNYAFRLSQLPIWVFVAAVYSVVLPSMSQDVALQRKARLTLTITRAFKSILIVTLPTTLFLYDLRVPIVSLLFQRGAFDEHSVRMTADMVGGYALSIAGLSISAVCLRYFLAAGKMILPIGITLMSTGMNLAADYVLKDSFGAAGLGYGAAIGASVNAALFLLCVCGELDISLRERFRGLFPIITANVILLLYLLLIAEAWPNKPEQVQALIVFAKAGCTAIGGILVYFAVLRFLNNISNRR
jgi:putative peptidoglycan lipid II flippase